MYTLWSSCEKSTVLFCCDVVADGNERDEDMLDEEREARSILLVGWLLLYRCNLGDIKSDRDEVSSSEEQLLVLQQTSESSQ